MKTLPLVKPQSRGWKNSPPWKGGVERRGRVLLNYLQFTFHGVYPVFTSLQPIDWFWRFPGCFHPKWLPECHPWIPDRIGVLSGRELLNRPLWTVVLRYRGSLRCVLPGRKRSFWSLHPKAMDLLKASDWLDPVVQSRVRSVFPIPRPGLFASHRFHSTTGFFVPLPPGWPSTPHEPHCQNVRLPWHSLRCQWEYPDNPPVELNHLKSWWTPIVASVKKQLWIGCSKKKNQNSPSPPGPTPNPGLFSNPRSQFGPMPSGMRNGPDSVKLIWSPMMARTPVVTSVKLLMLPIGIPAGLKPKRWKTKLEIWVFEALEQIRERLPFPLFGIDSDNGGEFINNQLVRYCQREKITFTRSRASQKNDNSR